MLSTLSFQYSRSVLAVNWLLGHHLPKGNNTSCITLFLLVSIPLQQRYLSAFHCPEASWLRRQWIQRVRHLKLYKPHDDTIEL